MNVRETVAEMKAAHPDLAKLPDSKVEEIIRGFLEVAREKLQAGDIVVIRGFGRFEVHHNKTGRRVAYNFQTGETSKVPCKAKVKFTSHFPVGDKVHEEASTS